MSAITRIITARTEDDVSIFAREDAIEPMLAGAKLYRVWGWDEAPTLPFASPESILPLSMFPAAGGLRVNVAEFPAGMGANRAAKTNSEAFDRISGAGGDIEPLDEDPGLHATDTADIIVVISGEVSVELDNNVERTIRPGDIMFQMGTIHAWHNRTSEPCLVALIVVGLERS